MAALQTASAADLVYGCPVDVDWPRQWHRCPISSTATLRLRIHQRLRPGACDHLIHSLAYQRWREKGTACYSGWWPQCEIRVAWNKGRIMGWKSVGWTREFPIFYSYKYNSSRVKKNKYTSSFQLKKRYVIFDSQNLITNPIEPINEPYARFVNQRCILPIELDSLEVVNLESRPVSRIERITNMVTIVLFAVQGSDRFCRTFSIVHAGLLSLAPCSNFHIPGR